MSIQTAIENAQQKVENAYTAVQNKGGTMPATQNLSNLPTAINSISTAGTVEELNITPTTSAQTITPSAGVDGFNPVKVAAVTSAIDSDIKASNIKSGVNILGVNGSVVELNGQTKTVNPTTSQQTITPDSPKNGLTSVTINAVTAAIDSDIQPANIKKNVNILGVTGTLEEGITPTGIISITENGQFDVANYATANVNVSGGGGGGEGRYLVRVIDYDGTVLKSEKLDTGNTFTLPSNPSHSGLVFQSWSSPVTITNNTVTVTDSDITIGATYTTASGLSEFDITLTAVTGLSVTLNMDGTKNWGDGTSDTSTTHTYASEGNYTITCDGTTMTTSSSSGIMGQSSSNNARYILTSARMANVTSIGGYAFAYCYSLASITIPSGVTSIGGYAFAYCCSLTLIIIPSSVTSIESSAFNSCHSIIEYDFSSHTSVPTLSSTNAFNNINGICKIKVPARLEARWKAATNWSTYANYIVGV